MQIVIELSELDYKWITLRKGDETLYPLTLTVYDAIKNGTPLKTGHWVRSYGNCMCSECGHTEEARRIGKATHFCSFCGAKMVEPQESEDKG